MNASTRVLWQKEFRALVPLWGASVAAVSAAAFARQTVGNVPPMIFFTLTAIAALAFAVGAISLGAQSVGHEYTHRTLPILLSQPRTRGALLTAKVGVVVPMVLTLSTLAWWSLFRDEAALRGPLRDFLAPILVAACAIFLAPWMTMISRSTLAGIVFTFSIPPSLLIAGDVIGVWHYGDGAGVPIDRLKFGLLWWGTLSACAVAAVAGWRTFMRLEAVEGVARHLEVPQVYARSLSRKRTHPIVLLVKKELRLQQMTFVLVAIYATALVSLRLTQGADTVTGVFFPVTVLYAVLLGAVIGSLALAEERQFGVQDVQRLLPIAFWKQWMVKASTAFTLALLLGFVLPMLVAMLGSAQMPGRPRREWLLVFMPIVLVTSGSLYASSLSSSGVRAAVMSLPAFVAAGVLVQTFMSMLRTQTGSRVLAALASAMPFDRHDLALGLIMEWTPTTLAASLTVLLVTFAYGNESSGERSSIRVVRQLLCLVVIILALLTLEATASTARYGR